MSRPKIHGETLDAMRQAIAPFDTPERRARYLAGDFARADRVDDLDKRYRWDLAWEANVYPSLPAGLLDSHVDTALRSIVAPLEAT